MNCYLSFIVILMALIWIVRFHLRRRVADPPPDYTLTAFIENNYKLLAALGVLTALTAFSSSIRPPVLGYALAFALFVASAVIFLELLGNMPDPRFTSPGLLVFFCALGFACVMLIIYLALTYRQVITLASEPILMAIFLAVFIRLPKYVPVFRLVDSITKSKSPVWKSILIYVIGFDFLAISCSLTVVLSNSLARILSDLATRLSTIPQPPP